MFVLNWAIPTKATPTWAAPTCRCGRGERSPDADAAGASAVPVQMWQGGEPSPGTDMAGVSRVPVQMWQRCAQSRRRCGRGGPSPGADVAAVPARGTRASANRR